MIPTGSDNSKNKDLNLQRIHHPFDEFIKYNAHYQIAKDSFLKASERQSYTSIFAVLNIKDYRDKQTRSFIKRIRENDSRYKLLPKDYEAILEELISMFLVLKRAIVSLAQRKDSEYQRISSQNREIFHNSGKAKKFQPYCQPAILINFDLFSIITKRNYEYENYPYKYRIQDFITTRIISKISQVPLNHPVYRAIKKIWEKNYWFIRQTEEMSYFYPLLDLLFLLNLKIKQNMLSQSKSAKHFLKQHNHAQLSINYPQQIQMTNQQPFYFHFSQLFMLRNECKGLNQKKQVERVSIKQKMEKILCEQEVEVRHRQLRRLLFLNSISLRSIIEWWNCLSLSNNVQIEQLQIRKALQPLYWQYLEQGGFNQAFSSRIKMTAYVKKIQEDQNVINLQIFKMALRRITRLSKILSIQNHTMIDADEQEPLYISYFSYYFENSNCQKNISASSESNMKNQAVVTIYIGVVEQKIVFTLVINEKFDQYIFHQILTTFLIKNRQFYPSSIIISDFNYSNAGFQETITQRLIHFFKKKMKSFMKIDPRITSYCLHYMVYQYLQTYLSSKEFQSESSFSEAIERQLLTIITSINQDPANYQYLFNRICKIK